MSIVISGYLKNPSQIGNMPFMLSDRHRQLWTGRVCDRLTTKMFTVPLAPNFTPDPGDMKLVVGCTGSTADHDMIAFEMIKFFKYIKYDDVERALHEFHLYLRTGAIKDKWDDGSFLIMDPMGYSYEMYTTWVQKIDYGCLPPVSLIGMGNTAVSDLVHYGRLKTQDNWWSNGTFFDFGDFALSVEELTELTAFSTTHVAGVGQKELQLMLGLELGGAHYQEADYIVRKFLDERGHPLYDWVLLNLTGGAESLPKILLEYGNVDKHDRF